MSRHGRGGGHARRFLPEAIGLGALAGAAGGAYKLGEFLLRAKRLHDVGGENAVFVRVVRNVRADLREAERLLRVPCVRDALRGSPERVRWVRDAVARVRAAVEEISKFTGRVEDDVEKKKQGGWFAGLGSGVTFGHRLLWTLDEQEKVLNRRIELSTAHQSLLAVIGFLAQFEPMGCCDDGRWRGGVFVEQVFDEGYDEPRDREVDVEVSRERTMLERNGSRRSDRLREGRAADFLEGRRIVMEDREALNSVDGFGYGGGDGSRRSSDIDIVQRAYEFDEPDSYILRRERLVRGRGEEKGKKVYRTVRRRGVEVLQERDEGDVEWRDAPLRLHRSRL